jgi:hypothetical protein
VDDKSNQGEDTEREGIYIGESSRSLYVRSREHIRDAEDFKEGSHIIKNWINCHPETSRRPPFKFSILQTLKYCLYRQVAEAVIIHYSSDKLLNSKNEYNSICLTRLVVEESTFEERRGKYWKKEQLLKKREIGRNAE